jgi:hypothetical protein
MAWCLIGLAPVGVATALLDGVGAGFWLALVLGALQGTAGILLLREVPASGALARLASGLSAPLIYPWGAWHSVLFEQFSRPEFARYFGARPDPAGPRGRRRLLLWLVVLMGLMGAAFASVLPRALETAKEWQDPPSPLLEAWAFAGTLFSPKWWRAAFQLSLPLLVLWCWSRMSRVGFYAVGGTLAAILVLVAGPFLVVPLQFDYAAQKAREFEAMNYAPTLLRGLSEADPKMRIAAARGLERLGRDASSASSALARALEDPDRRVRLAAACALGRLDPRAETAVPILVKVLKEEQSRPLDRSRAMTALGRLGPLARPALWILLDNLASDEESAEALSEIGVPSIPGLCEALSQADPLARRRAAATLGRIGPAARSAVDILSGALKDPDPKVRIETIRALEAIQGPKAVPVLLPLLEDPQTAQAAAAALSLQGEREGLGPLREGGYFLNPFRRPATWDHLKKTPVESDLEGTGREILEAIGGRALMKVVIPHDASLSDSELEILSRFRRIHVRADRHSLADVLVHLGLEFLLDSETIRILPRSEARRFWATWLTNERGG